MIEALKKVKTELGEDAVILDSGKVDEDGVSYYEVIAAVDEGEPQIEMKPLCSPNLSAQENSDLEILKREILEIKRDLKLLLNNKPSFGRYSHLLKEGVPEEIIELLEKSEKSLKEFLVWVIERKGVSPTSKVQIFIGEPGSGKTTLIFKMAFWLRIKKNARVVVLNADNYKIGGKEQSQKLAQLLEIPLYQIDWDDFGDKYNSLSKNFDYILIDTPSMGKKFSLYELKELSQAYPFLRFHWVLRVSENSKNLFNLWKEIKELPLENISLSFLDKLHNGFSLFWLLLPEIPVPSYASTGERIPEDFERLEKEKFLNYLLKETEKYLN